MGQRQLLKSGGRRILANTCEKCQTQYTDGVKCMCGQGCGSCSEGAPVWSPGSCSDPSPFYGVNETGTGLDEPEVVKLKDGAAYQVDYSLHASEVQTQAEFAKVTRFEAVRGNPLSTGPDHYRRHSIQPIQVIQDWNLPYELGNVLKYISRFDVRGGLRDLQKAKHYLELMIARQGGGDEGQ